DFPSSASMEQNLSQKVDSCCTMSNIYVQVINIICYDTLEALSTFPCIAIIQHKIDKMNCHCFFLWLYILLQLHIIICYAVYYTPTPRVLQSSALVGEKLYFIGGSRYITSFDEYQPDFFYLDLSIEFNASAPAFTSLGLQNNWVGFD